MTSSEAEVLDRVNALDAALQDQARRAFYHMKNEAPASETYPLPLPLALSEAVAGGGAGTGGAGPEMQSLMTDLGTPFALSSFTMYEDPTLPADDTSGKMICEHPTVIVGEKKVTVEEPEDGYWIGDRTYYCHVYCQTGTWKAKIDDTEECDLGDAETRVCVPIAEISTEPSVPVKQLHTGAIVLDFDGKLLASFAVYADSGTLRMYNPLVSCPPPNSSIVPSGETDNLVSGTYYCHVLRDDDGSSYEASVDRHPTKSAEGKKSVLDVKICTIAEDSEGNPRLGVQYHVGVICADARPSGWFAVDGEAVTRGEAGETVSRFFGVDIAQGILDKLNAEVTFKEKGRDGGIISIKERSGSESSGSESSSSESSSSTSELELIKEITGAEIKDDKLVLKVRKVRIKIPYEEDSTSESVDLVPVGKHSCCEEE